MNKKSELAISNKKQFVFLGALLLIYIILFEFVLPGNRILPKPSLLVDSFTSLWSDYNLWIAIIYSTALVYFVLFSAYFIFVISAGKLVEFYSSYPGIINNLKIFFIIPAIFYAALFLFWFPGSVAAEYVFIFIAAFSLFSYALFKEIGISQNPYVDAARGLGIDKKNILSKVIWKSKQPALTKSFYKIHKTIWGIILIYEFVSGFYGLGAMIKDILSYNDFSGLIAIGITLALIIIVGEWIIRYIIDKIIYWE